MSDRRSGRSARSVVRHLPRPVLTVLAGVLINRLGSFFAMFATLFLRARGFSTGELAPILLGVAVSSTAGSLVAGRLTDRFGPQPTMIGSVAASSAAMFMLAFATGRLGTIVGVLLVGLVTQS